jgi:hypothetical protein
MKKTHRILSLVFVFAACLLVLAPAAKADTAIYNNFTTPVPTSSSFNSNEFPDPFNIDENGRSAAMPFTPNSNYDLTQIIIALGNVDTPGADVIVSINADSGGGSPGNVLELWTVTPANWAYAYNPYAPEVLNSTGPTIVLLAGQQYWVTASCGDCDSAWNLNSTGVTGTVGVYPAYGNGWNTEGPDTTGAFEVSGDPVGAPEPGTMTLLGLGLGALGIFRRRRTV